MTGWPLIRTQPGWNTIPVALSNGDGTFNVTNQNAGDFATWAQGETVTPLVANLG